MNWRRFFRREAEDAEQRRELELYLEITAEEYAAQGMARDEARRAARRKLGNLTRIREEVYEMNTATFVEGTLREVRHAARMLRRNPAFSLTAILTLALGIGATTAMFSVVNGVVIKPLPYPDSDEVVTVGVSAVFGNGRTPNFPLAPQLFTDYTDNSRSFEALGLYSGGEATVTGVGEADHVSTLPVTQGFLPTFHVPPALGRWFSPADHRPEAPDSVILMAGYWQRRFGGDPEIIGRTITINSSQHQIIGVMPEGFFEDFDVDLILPLRWDFSQPPPGYCCQGVARLKPGATIEQANADVSRLLDLWKLRENRAALEDLQLGPAVRPLKDDIVGDIGNVLWVLLGSIGILLLIACANVANLLLVRAEGRGQELAVRTTLGAGWGHITRALIVESLTLSLAGGLIGVGLAYAGLRILVASGPANLPRLSELTIDGPVFAFAMATSLLSGLLFGLIPAVKTLRKDRAGGLQGFLGGASRWASAGRSQQRSQNVLVVVQVAFALVLSVSSGLMIRTFQNLRGIQPGFTSPETLQSVRIALSSTAVENESVTRVQQNLLDRLAAIPGVESAAFVDSLPMEQLRQNAIVAAEGNEYGASGIPPTRTIRFVSPGALETFGTPLLYGRDFTWEELYNQRNVAMVSEGFARDEWGTVEGAIGKRVLVGTSQSWQEVIGVVADVYDSGVDQEPPHVIYWPSRLQDYVAGTYLPRSVNFVMRSDRTGTEGFLREIREAVGEVMPDVPVFQVRTLREVYDQSMARTSFSLVLLGIAGAMALLLGVVGIYGVLAYAVVQRRREVGIRLALGAEPRAVKKMFVSRGMILAGVGVMLGMAAAASMTRLMSALLFGVTPVDAATFAAAAGVLVVAALAASYLPARRAAAVDPVETLRAE